MAKSDFYELLQVPRNASAEDLKKAYRKLAMQYHPDKNPGNKEAEAKFKAINEAYDVLKDDQKRAAYDRYGHQAFEGGGGGHGAAGFDFAANFSDIFDDLFGNLSGNARRGGGAKTSSTRGSDVRYDLGITLEEAFKGAQHNIRVSTSATCEPCHGSGAEKGTKPITCPTCAGQGRIRANQGFFTVERTCHTCGGSGQVVRDPCRACSGAGRVRRDRTLAITIPQGVEEGTRIRVSGEGEAGVRGGPPGDLYVFIALRKHALFERDGADLHCRVPIPMTMAALGGTVEVPTLAGKVKVTIPEGTQTGKQFRVRGKGMPVLRSSQHGDLYIHTVVETPVKLTKRQKELLREFDGTDGTGHSPQSEGFFSKVKELWDDLKE